MPELSRTEPKGIPKGLELPVVDIDPKKLERLNTDDLVSKTAAEFERVRHYFPIGRNLFDRIDRRIQQMRGRDRNPISAIDNQIGYFDNSFTLYSPVASVSGKLISYCAAVDADMFEFYYGHEVPFVSMLEANPNNGMTINIAKPVLLDVGEDGQIESQHFDIAPIELVRCGKSVSADAQVGLGAVYLALKASY